MLKRTFIIALLVCSLFLTYSLGIEQSSADKVLGRWDITVQAADGASYPSWLEVTRDGDKLAGRFVGRTGSQRPLQNVEFADGHLSFSLPVQYEQRASALTFKAKLMGDKLEGTTTDPAGKELKWTARRAPSLARRSAPKWGKPVSLFNGRDLKGWKLRNPKAPGAWEVVEGAMVNAPHSTDLITEQKFTDFKLRIEFKMVEKSNSGVYLRGRYEVQVQDDFGKPPDSRGIGGIYGFIAPESNAVKKAGEWQTYDITLIGRTVTVVLNGETIINEAEIPGITGGALDSDEGAPGPIMLQGDHTQIHYRNITITPAR